VDSGNLGHSSKDGNEILSKYSVSGLASILRFLAEARRSQLSHKERIRNLQKRESREKSGRAGQHESIPLSF